MAWSQRTGLELALPRVLPPALHASLVRGHGFVSEALSFHLLVPRCLHPTGSRRTSFAATTKLHANPRGPSPTMSNVEQNLDALLRALHPSIDFICPTHSIRQKRFSTFEEAKESRSISSHSPRVHRAGDATEDRPESRERVRARRRATRSTLCAPRTCCSGSTRGSSSKVEGSSPRLSLFCASEGARWEV